MTDVFEALRANNGNAGGGYIVHNGEVRVIRGEGLVARLADIEEIVLDERERHRRSTSATWPRSTSRR